MTDQQRIAAFAAYPNAPIRYKVDHKGDLKLKSVFFENNCIRVGNRPGSETVACDYVQMILKPLSSISDEDAVEVAKMAGYAGLGDPFELEGRFIMNQYFGNLRVSNIGSIQWQHILDYLRSKSYNCGYMGYDLVKEGIAIEE